MPQYKLLKDHQGLPKDSIIKTYCTNVVFFGKDSNGKTVATFSIGYILNNPDIFELLTTEVSKPFSFTVSF